MIGRINLFRGVSMMLLIDQLRVALAACGSACFAILTLYETRTLKIAKLSDYLIASNSLPICLAGAAAKEQTCYGL